MVVTTMVGDHDGCLTEPTAGIVAGGATLSKSKPEKPYTVRNPGFGPSAPPRSQAAKDPRRSGHQRATSPKPVDVNRKRAPGQSGLM